MRPGTECVLTLALWDLILRYRAVPDRARLDSPDADAADTRALEAMSGMRCS